MALFRRKKITRPKSHLGMALFKYDNIINKDIKGIINSINSKKAVNPKRGKAIFDGASNKFDFIVEDISKENLKIDYRSDKIRYMIIDMINILKTFFEKALQHDFDPEKIKEYNLPGSLGKVLSLRENIKKKMKDIESDYL